MPRGTRYVLDTSALLALRDDEAGAERVHRVIDAARKRRASAYLSFMTRMELPLPHRGERGGRGGRLSRSAARRAALRWVTCEPAILLEAARIKQRGGLSVTDAWIAATAALRQAVLVHKDPEFALVADLAQEHIGQ
jgi:predicted nucleic acid-binding protein